MIATNKLRFVEREIPRRYPNDSSTTLVRILQQWWAAARAGQITPTGEWRDVPVEKEENT
jgi:hypothetical protein